MKLGAQLSLMTPFFKCHFEALYLLKLGQNFKPQFQIGCWSAKDLLQWESAIYHSIKLGFEGPVAKKFLNGI